MGDFIFASRASLVASNATIGVLGGSMIYNEMVGFKSCFVSSRFRDD